MDVEKLIEEMTIDEKIALVSGTDFMYTNPIKRLAVRELRTSDGPHGLRVQARGSGDNGITGSNVSTAFPTAATSSCSFDPNNTFLMGKAMAEEANHYGIDIILGPACNIKRNPLAGRNFEYFSEDPLLSSDMAIGEVKGIQSQDVASCVKHYALNNCENYRFNSDSIVDKKAINDIYLNNFGRIIKKSKPLSVMCAYNKINGTYCCQNSYLLKEELRDKFEFTGFTMTDWGAMHNRVKAIKAGLDLEMPGDTAICRKQLKDAIDDKSLDIENLDESCRNILNVMDKLSDKKKDADPKFDEHDKLALQIAIDSAVLLKNDGMLPLNENKRYLVIGQLFDKMRYQGSGSSMINPYNLVSPKQAFDNNGVDYRYVQGYDVNGSDVDQRYIDEALDASKDFTDILVFLGLNDYLESEGCDREDMKLPLNQQALIKELTKLGKKITVVLYGGSSIQLDFKDEVDAILDMFLPGQEGGNATYCLLFGKCNPSGRLSETWIKKYKDTPFASEFSNSTREVYKESIFVGYRHYLAKEDKIAYPFGYGLSYTTFEYSDFNVSQDENAVTCTFKLTNTGLMDGKEVCQIYISKKDSEMLRPLRELKGFTKVFLKSGESKDVSIAIDKEDLKAYSFKEDRSLLEEGTYQVLLCKDSMTVLSSKEIEIKGEVISKDIDDDVKEAYDEGKLTKVDDKIFEKMSGLVIPEDMKKLPITTESRFSDLAKSKAMGRFMHMCVLSVANSSLKKAKKMKDGPEKDNQIKGAIFMKRVLESNSINSMSMCAGKSCPYNMALAFVHFGNGHIFKGLKSIMKPIKVCKLPKETKN